MATPGGGVLAERQVCAQWKVQGLDGQIAASLTLTDMRDMDGAGG